MQSQAVAAGYETVSLVEVGAQLVDIASLARVIAGGHDAAAQAAQGVFETRHIIALPAVQADGHGPQRIQRRLYIHAQGRVAFPRQLVGGFDLAV